MTYIPQNAAAKEIHEVYGDLNTAQHQWNTYAEKLGEAYTKAYGLHEKALGDAAEKLRASSEAMYFVLSLFCVGFGGGLAGGLMAPWVGRAGEDTANIIRSTLSGAAGSTTGTVIQKGIDATKSSGAAFSPASKNPLEYYQHMKGEIGEFFSVIRDTVEEEEKAADKEGAPHNYGEWKRKQLVNLPLVNDYPRTKDMPNVDEAARQAELGMWIGWANIRDIDYWKTRMDALADGVDYGRGNRESRYVIELRQYDSILSRLETLGEKNRASLTFTKGVGGSLSDTVLNIPKLAQLGKQLGGTFFDKIDTVVKSPIFARRMLFAMYGTPPIYKRGTP